MRQTGIKNSFSTAKRYKEANADELPFTLGKVASTKEDLFSKKVPTNKLQI